MSDRLAPAAQQGVLRLGNRAFPHGQAIVMGIVNRTPDSFFRPAVTWDESAAIERVHQGIADGADIVDVGGIPAAPGANVDVAEEIRRTAGFIGAIRSSYPDVVISADTWRHETGRAVCEAGADLLNDSWGGYDPLLAEVAAEFGAGLVCAHVGKQNPRTRPFRVAYADVMADVLDQVQLLARLDVQRPLEHRHVDLLALASDAVHDAPAIDPKRSITMEFFDGPGIPEVLGDEPRIRQVLSNLVANALQHTPASAEVTLRSRRRGSRR